MEKQDTIYKVEILGTGPSFDAVHATLDRFPSLPLPGASYLISGEEARDALLAHHGQGDVGVEARRATPPVDLAGMSPPSVVAAFISHAGRHQGLAFHWDEEAGLWCLSSTWQGTYSEGDDTPAESEEDAVRDALHGLLIDQEREVHA